MSALIEFDAVCKYYQMGDTTVKAADHITMKIEKGEFVAIVGQSGSGKSTAMNIIGCLDVPTSGTYHLGGVDVSTMDDDQQAEIRNKMLGFIFQQYNLIQTLTVQENVELPLIYQGVPASKRADRVEAALERGLIPESVRELTVAGDPGAFRLADFQTLETHNSHLFRDTSHGALGRLISDFIQKAMCSRPQVEKSACIGCGHCRDICPAKAIVMENKLPRIDRKECIHCFCCQEFCPKGAMEVRRAAIARLLNR